MIGFSYRYLEGADGRRYCFAAEPSFECPVGAAENIDGLDEFAAAIGVAPEWLLRRIRHNGGRHRDDGGKLADTCDACGHKLKRLGFACWVEALPATDATDDQLSTSRMRKRLGGEGFVRVEGQWYQRTRKDAADWARTRTKAVA